MEELILQILSKHPTSERGLFMRLYKGASLGPVELQAKIKHICMGYRRQRILRYKGRDLRWGDKKMVLTTAGNAKIKNDLTQV